MVNDEMQHLQMLGVASAAIEIIKKIAIGDQRTLTKEEIFAIVDSHRLMFNYVGDLFNERNDLQHKLSKMKYIYNKRHKEVLEDIEEMNK